MNTTCAGFWLILLANGGTLYADQDGLERALQDLRPSHQVQSAVCRPWGALPGLGTPRPRVQDVRIQGLGRQGYPTCAEAREAARWSDLPCAPATEGR